MPLHNLVDYFNDRLSREHRSSFSPFIVEDGKASGLFGPLRIDSLFTPIRHTLKPTTIAGHAAQITVAPSKPQHLYANQIENLLANNTAPATEFESIINFDRLCRTVHMLNYLTLSHLQGVLFLDVDPRHILGIKQDHGAYFEEVIGQCGLATNNVAIVLTTSSQYARYYQELIHGLGNYRRRGYQIALKLDYFNHDQATTELISQISPDFLSLSARSFEQKPQDADVGYSLKAGLRSRWLSGVEAGGGIRFDSAQRTTPKLSQLKREAADVLTALQQLQNRIKALGGLTILQQIDEKKSDLLARNAGFDLVEGGYYRAIAFDYLSPYKNAFHELKANNY